MPVTLGRHSYCFNINRKYGDPSVQIGRFCSIADHLDIICNQHGSTKTCKPKLVTTSPLNWAKEGGFISKENGDIEIGNEVWIGYNCTIVQPITIGDGAIIGAKTVLRKDVPPFAVVIGNPAQIIRYRFSDEYIKALLRIKWWDWDDATILSRIDDFEDIDVFISKYDT